MTNLAWDVDNVLPSVIADLHGLIEIPSVSSQPEHDDDVEACAELVAGMVKASGVEDVRILRAGGKPAVYAHVPGPEHTPTVLLYAHYDVQPTGERSLWTSAPFSPEERQGRLYGRGSADDKGGIAVHLSTLRAFDGQPPVGVKLLIEGEEEIGSPSLSALLEEYSDELAADVVIVADAVNWQVGQPSLTTSLRGNIDAVVTVRTLEQGLHSGHFGGVVPDALTSLTRLLASLHDERGNVAVEGLRRDPAPQVDYDEHRLRAETGVLPGVEWLGEGSFAERLWSNPAISVIALDTTPVAEASNTLIPAATAKVSVRLAPSDNPAQAMEALTRHLNEHAPWGARVEVAPGALGAGATLRSDGPIVEALNDSFEEAFGARGLAVGVGGSIPLVAALQNQYPEATILLTAVVDPSSRMHGIDESLELADLARAADAEASFLVRLARMG